MHYHIILTELCNSNCKYCYEKSMKEAELGNDLKDKFEFDFTTPEKSKVSLVDLKQFLNEKEDVLVFYGGEPLTEIDRIKEIIDNIKLPFRMQTNGLLLDKLDIKYLKKIDKILISIDGTKERTDFNRGKGTYDKIISNIKKIRQEGYSGELIARMTINQSDIYQQVLHIIELIKQGLFDSIHWQLDAGFYKHDFNEENFSEFVRTYNHGISKLIRFWIDEMSKGKIWKIYPFIGIMESLLNEQKTKLRCGAGHSGFAITTDGQISACPIKNCVRSFYVGDIKTKKENFKQINLIEPCLDCKYLDLCGGRCLYSNHAKLWSNNGEELICKTIKYLINELKQNKATIKDLINKKIISSSDFKYEKYFGPEIIP